MEHIITLTDDEDRFTGYQCRFCGHEIINVALSHTTAPMVRHIMLNHPEEYKQIVKRQHSHVLEKMREFGSGVTPEILSLSTGVPKITVRKRLRRLIDDGSVVQPKGKWTLYWVREQYEAHESKT